MVTIREYIEKMANAKQTTGNDDGIFQGILRKLGFSQAIVTCGIVYLEGHGTMEAPPTPISAMAKMIIKTIS
jgi:hypothetical protein